MALDPTRILNRIEKRRSQRDGTVVVGWVLGVVPDGHPVPLPFKEYLAADKRQWVAAVMERDGATSEVALRAAESWTPDRAARRWRTQLHYYVASDRDGQHLLREAPFLWPASAVEEGLLRTLLFPDGMRDLIPGVSPDDDKRCAVTQSEDPAVVAGWWFYWNHTDYPHVQDQRMYRDKAEGFLPRTEV